jgi:hypothetical protein
LSKKQIMKLMYLLKPMALSCMVLLARTSDAQIVSCNAFLQGQYVEIGISPSGSYGSSVAAPSGYHPHGVVSGSSYNPCTGTTGSSLGFVCDPAMDGWTVGTPAYMGDYFLPGTPFEGWSIQVDTGGRRDAWNTLSTGFTGGLTGSNISYSSAGGSSTSTWQGNVDSVTITQTTTLDTSALYFIVNITFTNTGHLPRNNVYYYRSVDPDNDETWPGGSFVTNNTVEHQALDTTVVSATGTSSSAPYLALGTVDTNAECFIYNSWSPPTSTSIASMYNHTATGGYFYSGNHNGDIAIGLAFRIAHLATVDSASDSTYRTTSFPTRHPANSATIHYFYAFSHAAVDSAITYLNRTPPRLGVNNLNDEPEVAVYPNPATSTIRVSGLKLSDELTLYDMMGRPTVLTNAVTSAGLNSFSISGIPTGNYILQVKDEQGSVRARTRIQKQ